MKRYDIDAAKSLAWQQTTKYRSSKVPNKKKYIKARDRRSKKVKHY